MLIIRDIVHSGGTVHAVGTAASVPSELSQDQWQKLISILGNSDDCLNSTRLMGESSCLSWIVDTGATLHATGTLSCLVDQFEGAVCPVILPNGVVIHATRRGRVILSDKCILQNVVYVPSLSCNLISVSQLMDDCLCDVFFTHNMCIFQDRKTRIAIGAGERRGGLYYFSNSAAVSGDLVLAVQKPDAELWHSRLGHPSERVLAHLPFVSSSHCHLNKACETCH